MGDAFKFLEGLTFYGTLAALAVMAGMWYFWFHILPKIKAYDHSRKLLEIIVPKIGDDLNIIEQATNEARESLTKSLIAIAEELSDVSIIETAPSMEGRAMNLILAPSKEKSKKDSNKKKVDKPSAEKKQTQLQKPVKEKEVEGEKQAKTKDTKKEKEATKK